MPKALNIDIFLKAAFLKAELDFLKSQPRFSRALRELRTSADFKALVELGQELLTMHQQGNLSARQFRRNWLGIE